MTRRRIGLFVVLAVVSGACWGGSGRRLPAPSSTSAPIGGVTTTAPDYSTVVLSPVAGQPTTTLATTGDAVLLGRVDGPDGPVPAATVRIERFVGGATQSWDVLTAADGTWKLEGAPGGRFRIRAYRAPDLVQPAAEVLYLADGDSRQLALLVETVSGLVVTAGTTPTDPVAGQGVNVAVRVAERTVDADGVARAVPLFGALVRLQVFGLEPLGPDEVLTDLDGIAVFELVCDRPGAVTATAYVGSEQVPYPLTVAPCGPAAATTSTTTAGSSTSSTATTLPSTSTTEEP